MIPNILPILASAVTPATESAAQPVNAQQIDSAIANSFNEADQVIHEIEDQGVGFFPNLWQNHSDDIIRFAKTAILALIVLVAIKVMCTVAQKLITRSFNRFEAMDKSLSYATYMIVRTLIWVVGLLIILDLFGFNTASLLTVLGAVGLTIGLAMKDSLSNIAAGIMLLILRPYKQGDYIDCGSISGNIQQMGMFSTELKTADGLFVSAPNSVVFGTPIKNYSRNATRRTDITVGIGYEDSLPVALNVLKEIMMQEPMVLKDPAPEVLVAELADSSVNLTLRYWTTSEDYWPAYWTIKARLKPVIEGAGLNIPFPQRVITFVNAPETTPGA